MIPVRGDTRLWRIWVYGQIPLFVVSFFVHLFFGWLYSKRLDAASSFLFEIWQWFFMFGLVLWLQAAMLRCLFNDRSFIFTIASLLYIGWFWFMQP